MTIATLVCLTASLCVNPVNISYVAQWGDEKTCIVMANNPPCLEAPMPIAEVLRKLDQGPVAVTFAPEPRT